MHLGFIGLGNLGRAIAGRLLDCGHELTVYNRTAGKAQGLAAQVAASPAEVARRTDVVFLCLFDSQAVEDVLTGEDGVVAAGLAGKVVVDLTTNHFRRVPAFHHACRQAGGAYLEAPVLGSVKPASQGALTVLVSGGRQAFDRVEPVLRQIGRHLFYLVQPGLATKMKLVNNLTLGSFMATLAEAVALGEQIGLERRQVLDILAVGGGDSLVLNAKREKLLAGDFSPHFSNALIYKDLHCLQDLAYAERAPLFTAAVAKELYGRAVAEGMGEEDFSAVFKLVSPGRDG